MTGEPFNGLEHPTLSDRIYQLIKERIVRHELDPGVRLLEQDIAAELGVSRTPVRVAMTRLAAAGLVKVVPRRGVFVSAPSAKDIVDLYQVREALEVLAVQLATPLLKDDDLSALEMNLAEFRSALGNGQHLDCFELDRSFHDKLVSLSGNKKLIEVNALVGGSIQVTRWIHCHDRPIQEVSIRAHRAILDALARRDANLACSSVRDHIRRVKADLLGGWDENA